MGILEHIFHRYLPLSSLGIYIHYFLDPIPCHLCIYQHIHHQLELSHHRMVGIHLDQVTHMVPLGTYHDYDIYEVDDNASFYFSCTFLIYVSCTFLICVSCTFLGCDSCTFLGCDSCTYFF